MITHPHLSTICPRSIIPHSAIIRQFTNIYMSELGEGVQVGPFVEIGGSKIGARTKISSHAYICPNVVLGEDCFIAHGVQFTNDKFSDVPQYKDMEELSKVWQSRPVTVGNRVRIGSGAVILPDVEIGDDAIIGAGAVVTKNVPSGTTVAGCPARRLARYE